MASPTIQQLLPSAPSNPDTLVTGSSGHLGAALILTLSQYNLIPLGIDVLPSKYTHHVGSITDTGFIAAILASNPTIKNIIHAATLHKPHVASHSAQSFIDVNITGTQTLLSCAAVNGRIRSFVFVSTTSAFGDALASKPGEPANWIDESVRERPKNIYGVTKRAAEDLCYLTHKDQGLNVVVLRTSRFFPEEDDVDERRLGYEDEALKVMELLYRRVDLGDVVSSCVCAVRKAEEVRWGVYVISAPSAFERKDVLLRRLDGDVSGAVEEVVPGAKGVFQQKQWIWLDRIDRVYDSRRAIRELDWTPGVTFEHALECVREGKEWRSDVALRVGKRGYHEKNTGVYTKR